MGTTRALDVAVVGAGPAGLASALSLAELGLKVAVVTARWPRSWSASEDYDLRVVALAPDAQQLLSGLQVWSAIESARVQPVLGMQVEDHDLSTPLRFDAAALGAPALAWIVELNLLTDRLARAWQGAGGAIYDGAQVTAMVEEDDLAVLQLDNSERLKARLVVAADGAQSPLRVAAGIGVERRDYGQKGVVCAISTTQPHGQLARQRFLPSGPLAFLPLADGRCSIVWSTDSEHADYLLGLDAENFCATLGAASKGMLGEVDKCGERAAFPLRLQLAQQYAGARLVLLGDAAHQVHPLAGQGLNLGLRDVRRLTEVLRWAKDGELDVGMPSVLRRYQRPRRSEGWIAAHAFDGLERWFGLNEGPLAQLRQRGFEWVANSPLAKHWLARKAIG